MTTLTKEGISTAAAGSKSNLIPSALASLSFRKEVQSLASSRFGQRACLGMRGRVFLFISPSHAMFFTIESWVIPTIIHNYQVCARTVKSQRYQWLRGFGEGQVGKPPRSASATRSLLIYIGKDRCQRSIDSTYFFATEPNLGTNHVAAPPTGESTPPAKMG